MKSMPVTHVTDYEEGIHNRAMFVSACTVLCTYLDHHSAAVLSFEPHLFYMKSQKYRCRIASSK